MVLNTIRYKFKINYNYSYKIYLFQCISAHYLFVDKTVIWMSFHVTQLDLFTSVPRYYFNTPAAIVYNVRVYNFNTDIYLNMQFIVTIQSKYMSIMIEP